MKRVFCVLCIVTALIGFNLAVLADPHGVPGTGEIRNTVNLAASLADTGTDSK